MCDVCVVGYITREWEIWPNGVVKEIIAGAAYFVSIALAKLGNSVRVITKVDPEDKDLIKVLEELNIEVINTGSKTMKSKLIYKSLSERDIEVVSPSESFSIDDIELCRNSRVIYLGPQTVTDIDIEVLSHASRYGSVVLDVQGYTRRIVNKRIEYVDWVQKNFAQQFIDALKIDHREGSLLTKFFNPIEILNKLFDIGYRNIVLTVDEGVYLGVLNKGIFYAPYHIDRIVGRTGRGDTALASYIHTMLRNWDPFTSVRFVAAATSLKLATSGPLRASEKDVLTYMYQKYY